MHHVTIDDWSRGQSFLHHRDPRAKIAALLVLLVGISVVSLRPITAAITFLLLALIARFSNLPLIPVLKRSAIVLPFCLVFAIGAFLSGDRAGALELVLRTYLSGFSALLFVATTPLPLIVRGLEQLRAPVFLLSVMQFLYRYLFVLSEEAQHMTSAAMSRGGWRGRAGFQAAAGALGVLFARSHSRAGHIHQAMLSRGYNGRLPVSTARALNILDLVLVVCAAVGVAGLHFGARF